MALVQSRQATRDQAIIDRPSSAYTPLRPGVDTTSRFRRADGTWAAERQILHDAIVRKHFQGATPVSNPTAYAIGGGPASGKGTAIMRNTKFRANRVTIDSDEIKGMLPEYREMLKAKNFDAARFAHEESSYLAKLITKRSAEGRYNFMLDGTGDSGFDKLTGKLRGMRSGGARIEAHYVTVDTDEAVRRAVLRAERSGRGVPKDVIRDTHISISDVLPRVLKEGGHFDDFVLWDNNGAEAFKVAIMRDGVLDILDPVAWQRFLDKAPG